MTAHTRTGRPDRLRSERPPRTPGTRPPRRPEPVATRRRAAAGLILLAVLAAWPAGPIRAAAPRSDAAADGAREVVRETIDQVLAILANKDWPADRRVSEIEKIAYARFDFPTISRLVLARNYAKFSPAQQKEFVSEFKSHLSRSYGSRVDRYEQEKVDIIDARVESRGDVTVRTKIVGGQADGIEMNYRLRQSNGQWMVIDVVIEGVSLISSFRSQFKEVVNQGGPELLLERLKDKNARFDVPTGSDGGPDS